MTSLPRIAALLAMTGAVAGCTSTEQVSAPPSPRVSAAPAFTPQASTFSGPVLDGSGTCTATAPNAATDIAPGIGECELVRLKGKPPTDVLVGEGRAGREVQVLYNEPGAKELYFFINNKLDRIVKS